MPSEERKELALQAIRPRIDVFQSALTVTINQVQALLVGAGESSEDQSAALGKFAQGKVDFGRFASFTRRSAHIEPETAGPVRTAHEVLKSLLAQGDDLFILETKPGEALAEQVGARLAHIGRAFAAARVVDLAKSGAYKEDKHAITLSGFPYAQWNSSERALAPGMLIEVPGEDFTPSAIVPLLDANMKIVFNVLGDAPAAALSRVISPGVFVQQEIADANLDAFAAYKGIAVAAYLPETAVSFVHDPSAGTTVYDHFVSLTFPKEVRKRAIGGISPAQQAEDYALLESLAVPPELQGDAASDPAGKLSAWLLSQTNLSDLSAS